MSECTTSFLQTIDCISSQVEKIEVHANTRYVLNDRASFWLIVQGKGDLFVADQDQEVSKSVFVAEANTEDVIIGSSYEHNGKTKECYFLSNSLALLWKIPIKTAREIVLTNNTIKTLISTRIEILANALASFVFSYMNKEMKIDRLMEGETKAALGEIIGLPYRFFSNGRTRVAWIEILQGHFRIEMSLYSLSLEAGTLYPLCEKSWVISDEEGSKILCYETEQVIQSEGLWKGLFLLYDNLFRIIDANQAKTKLREADHFFNKLKEENELIKDSLISLGSVLNKEIPFLSVKSHDNICAACSMIAEKLGVIPDLRFFNKLDKELSTDEKIKAFSEINGICYRSVSLKGRWWKSPTLLILAFFKNQPVVLDTLGSRYKIISVTDRTSRKLIKKLIPDFSENAYVFYNPLPKNRTSLLDFFRINLKNNIKNWRMVWIYALLGGVLNLFPPFATKVFFSYVFVVGSISLLNLMTLGLVASSILSSLVIFANSRVLAKLQALSIAQIQPALFYHLINLGTGFFKKFSSGKILSDFMLSSGLVDNFIQSLVSVFISFAYFILYLAVMFYFNSFLSILSLFIVIIPTIGMMFFLNKLVNRGFDVNQLAGAMNGTAVQALTGIEKLRITAGERRFFSRWAHSSVIKYNISMEISRLNLMISWLQGILPNFVTAIILSCFLFQIGQLSLNAGSPELLGSFLGFYAALIPFVSYVLSIWSSIASIVQSLASWKTTKAMLQEPSDDLVVNKIRPVLQGGVSINNVTFCYNKDEKPVLKNLNITIKPNELVAITGPSGCGKSTLVRLLLGLEKVVDGSIYYDSQSLENLDLRAVRQQIGTVLQNTGIIAGSIYENICGAGIYSRAEVEKVIDAVGFTEELKTFPMGLGTILSMGGTNLSGGQRQRLLLARALIGAPKILILDEATSSLDVITQEKIISNLEKMNVTRIVIAHRLSTIRNAHQIYVLNEGCVVETGTFQELLAQRGIFATMAMRQKI